MKKFISLTIGLLLLVSLTACGDLGEVSQPIASDGTDVPTDGSGAADDSTTTAVGVVPSQDAATATFPVDSTANGAFAGNASVTTIGTNGLGSSAAVTVVGTEATSTIANKTTKGQIAANTTVASSKAQSTTAEDGPIVNTTTHLHSWIKTTKQPATCTEQGYTLVEYSCGKKEKKDFIPALGHKMGEWRVTKHPTNTTPGESKRKCIYTDCNYSESKQVSVLPGPKTKEQKAILDLVNAERTKAGLYELSYYLAEQEAADQRAEDIKVHFAHYRPNGKGGDGDPFYVLLKGLGTDYYGCGENVAMHFHEAAQVMKGWMDSPKHKANILDPDFDALVVGFSDDYWVQLFINFD